MTGRTSQAQTLALTPHLSFPSHPRKLAGPWDVDFARELEPGTIRARFGKSKVQNAIHVTDLPTDGVDDVEFFFKIMSNFPVTD